MTWTSGRRSVAAALLFLAAAVLAGVTLVETGVEYHLFGIVEGVFALLLAYLLTLRGAWPSPEGLAGWAAAVYGTVATAQVLELLFPPPGLIEWVVVAGVAIAAWGVFAGGTRRRLVASLGSLAVLLAILKFSMIPVLWGVGPAKGSALGLGDAAEGVRRAFADYQPIRPAGQLVGFLAIACWVLATRLLWPRGEVAVETVEPEATAQPRAVAAPEMVTRSLAPPGAAVGDPQPDAVKAPVKTG